MFSIGDSLKYGWEKFKENVGLSIGAILLMFVVSMLGELDRDGVLIGLLAAIAGIIIQIGTTKMFLRMSDGEKPVFTSIFQEYKYFWKYLGASILGGLAMLGGLILLIIPGIIWAVRFSFATILVIDANMGPMEAMKESWAITKGKFWNLFGLSIVFCLINIAGFIALGVGLLVTVPVSIFAWIYVYRQLLKSKASIAVSSEVAPSTS